MTVPSAIFRNPLAEVLSSSIGEVTAEYLISSSSFRIVRSVDADEVGVNVT